MHWRFALIRSSDFRFRNFNPANRPKSLWRGCGLAIVCVTAALLATHSLKDPLFPTPMFFAAIVIATWFGGAIPGCSPSSWARSR